MSRLMTLAEAAQEKGISMDKLIELSKIERRVVEAIFANRYTPSPEQRQRLAAALSLAADEIAWGQHAPVAHVYGHGPQFGRSP